MKIKIGLLLFTSLSLFSCKTDKNTEKVLEEVQVSQKGIIDTNYENPSLTDDSVKVTIKYTSSLDTIKMKSVDQRYTLLYLTQNGVSLADLEKMIKEENFDQMKEQEVTGFDLRRSDSVHFYFKLKPDSHQQPLKIIVDDIVFLEDNNEKGQTRMIHHLTHYKEVIQFAK